MKRVYVITSRSLESNGMVYGVYTNRKKLHQALNMILTKTSSITYNEINKRLKEYTSFSIYLSNNDQNCSCVDIIETNLNTVYEFRNITKL